jgi:protein-export membrane protein SecD
MGEVFRAHDNATERVVAIKLLPAHLAEDPEYQQRFRREAHTAAGLSDPHVVPIHNYGEIEGRLYVDMRLVEGRDLGTLIADDGGRLHPARAVAITEQVASALDSAHRAGLVHRDVKPSNILIGERDFVYLIDFGIARAITDTAVTNTGQTVGTLAYMAPERFSGMTDRRADIYSLACVLHECLTGQRPYPGGNLAQQLADHLMTPPPKPSTICPDIPPEFDAVIARGMAKDPDERYQTTTALADAARAALTGDLATVVGPLPPARTERIPLPPPEPPTVITAPPRPASPSVPFRVTNYLQACLAVLIGAYLLTVLVAGVKRPAAIIDQQGGTRITWTAQPPPDGSVPAPETLSQARKIIASRVDGLGIRGSQVVVAGDSVIVTVPGNNGDEIRDIGQKGRLYIRPVITSTPAQSTGQQQQPAPRPPGNSADLIAGERKLRQTTLTFTQFMALQLQATRCDQIDVLAGNDDPTLPLVTCSTDHKTAYILGPAMLGNEQIDSASWSFSKNSGQYVVDLKFKDAIAATWADYTAAHIGAQTAFTLDSAVVSAPRIGEAISGGSVQIAGGFTAAQARHLANLLNYHPLPRVFEGSELQRVPPKPGPAQSRLLSPPTGVVAALTGLLLILVCLLLYRSYSRLRHRLRRTDRSEPAFRA